MQPIRPWVLVGIPLVAELGRISAGVYFDFGTFSSTLLLSGALAALLWRLDRLKAAKLPAPAAPPEAPASATDRRAEPLEIAALRHERDRLRTALDWHERLAGQGEAALRPAPQRHTRVIRRPRQALGGRAEGR